MDWKIWLITCLVVAEAALMPACRADRVDDILGQPLPMPAKQPLPTGPSGRYQMIINPQFRADEFLFDSETGRVWQIVKDNDGLLLQELRRLDVPKK